MHTASELPQNGSAHRSAPRTDSTLEELTQLKRQLLQAEIRLAKARAGASGAEADVKVLNSRLRVLTR